MRKYEIDNGTRNGVTTAEKERLKVLEREVKELWQANATLICAAPAQLSMNNELRNYKLFGTKTNGSTVPIRSGKP